jgi:hypothetical protein
VVWKRGWQVWCLYRHEQAALNMQELEALTYEEGAAGKEQLAFFIVLDLFLRCALHLSKLNLLLGLEPRDVRGVHERVLNQEVLELFLRFIIMRRENLEEFAIQNTCSPMAVLERAHKDCLIVVIPIVRVAASTLQETKHLLCK